MASSNNYDVTSKPRGVAQAPVSPKIMDFSPSKSLALGIKRIGGRSGVARLGPRGRGKGQALERIASSKKVAL